MKTIIILILVPVTVQAEYFSDFSEGDWWRQGVFTGLTIVDCAQTHEFVGKVETRYSGGGVYVKTHRESNIILGDEPSGDEINAYILLAIASHAFFVYAMPKKYRELFQVSSIFIEFSVVRNNYEQGVRISTYF